MAILFTALLTLVLVNERLNELLVNPILEELVAKKVNPDFDWGKVIRYTSFIFGIAVGYFFLVPVMAFMAETAGVEPVILSNAMIAFFSVVVGAGSQLLHDIWQHFTGQTAVLEIDAEIEPA